jgi:CubicO group peptidase (beta-lactamase class C family)
VRRFASTSGLPRENPAVPRDAPSEADMMKALAGFALENAPGSTHVYSNFGYVILGIALGRAARSSLHELVKKRGLSANQVSTYKEGICPVR